MPLPIDLDVRKVANDFGLDPALLQAVVKAEGDIVKAINCTFPAVTTREAALRITARSAVHAMCDFLKADKARVGMAAMFVDFWAARWAPVGATNDPTGLNRHWPRNVRRLWLGETTAPKADTGSDVPGGGAA